MNTLNSASLVNKGLELIETHLLFASPTTASTSSCTAVDRALDGEPSSTGRPSHQASPPDMKLPISLALGWPERVAGAAAACDFKHRLHLGVRAPGHRRVPRRSTWPAKPGAPVAA